MNKFINESKDIIRKLKEKIHVTICVPVYDELNRFKTKNEHPNGEDFLNVKITQCNELFLLNNNITYDLLIIDDGCPNNTGNVIDNYIISNTIHHCKVVYLQDAIEQNIFKNLNNVNESRKGGAIYYGLYNCITNSYYKEITNNKKHIIIYTDADISTDLRMCGLLIEKIINGSYVTIGGRHLPNSITIKKGNRSTRGKIHAYFWKKLFPKINYLSDTQTSFKAFDSQIVPYLLENINEFKFCFDVEILIKSNNFRNIKISQAPIYWVDSPNESKTNKHEYYVEILQSLGKLYDIYVKEADKVLETNQISNYLKNMTLTEYNMLLSKFKD